MNLHRWLYRGGRPNRLASIVNSAWAAIHSLGILPNYLVTLEVTGRRTGRTIRLPLAMVALGGERYLVSMLGDDVAWVRNARAAGGYVALKHGAREQVHLEEVPVELRAPILQAYLRCAPGARPHVPVDKGAPLADFAKIAARFPVFRVTARTAGADAQQR